MRQAVVALAKRGIYWFGTWTLTLTVKLLFRARYQGRARIPPHGAIVVARHACRWDVPLIIAAVQWFRRLHFLARHTLMDDHPLLRPFIRDFAIPIDRDRFRKDDFKRVMRALEANKLVGIFPQGTILATDQARTGVIRFAERSGRDILPVAIRARKGRYPPRWGRALPEVTVRIGCPFSLRDLEFDLRGDEAREQRYERLTRLLMDRIDRLANREAF